MLGNENKKRYELNLPTDPHFVRIYGYFKLIYEVDKNYIKIINIEPTELLNNICALENYRFFYIKKESVKDRFKVDLICKLDDK